MSFGNTYVRQRGERRPKPFNPWKCQRCMKWIRNRAQEVEHTSPWTRNRVCFMPKPDRFRFKAPTEWPTHPTNPGTPEPPQRDPLPGGAVISPVVNRT